MFTDYIFAIMFFQHLSTGATKFAENCPYVVTHTYPNPKAGVEVLWTAPPAGTGCIEFRFVDYLSLTVVQFALLYLQHSCKIVVL